MDSVLTVDWFSKLYIWRTNFLLLILKMLLRATMVKKFQCHLPTGFAQWWEHWPPIIVVCVRFRPGVYEGCVCCWFSPSSWCFSPLFSLSNDLHLRIPVRPGLRSRMKPFTEQHHLKTTGWYGDFVITKYLSLLYVPFSRIHALIRDKPVNKHSPLCGPSVLKGLDSILKSRLITMDIAAGTWWLIRIDRWI